MVLGINSASLALFPSCLQCETQNVSTPACKYTRSYYFHIWCVVHVHCDTVTSGKWHRAKPSHRTSLVE